jgi:hypothetical protein
MVAGPRNHQERTAVSRGGGGRFCSAKARIWASAPTIITSQWATLLQKNEDAPDGIFGSSAGAINGAFLANLAGRSSGPVVRRYGAPGVSHRHRTADAIRASFVAGCQHHPRALGGRQSVAKPSLSKLQS